MSAVRSRIAVVGTIGSLLAVGVLFTNFLPFRQILAQQRSLEHSQVQLAALQGENVLLEREVEALMSDSEIERIAREYFGYVMPGEQAIVVVSPPGSGPVAPSALPVLERDLPWWQQVWDFLTGRDLSG